MPLVLQGIDAVIIWYKFMYSTDFHLQQMLNFAGEALFFYTTRPVNCTWCADVYSD